jgi:hypothetical protein
MPGENARRWPVRCHRTLVNLQDRHRNLRPTQKLCKTHKEKPEAASRWGPIFGPSPAKPPLCRFKQFYRTIAITSCEIVSNVVTVFELASNARWATIKSENSVEILTFDCSNALSSTVPRPPVPATPATA